MNRRRLIITIFGYLTGIILCRKSGLFSKESRKYKFQPQDIGIDISFLFSDPEHAKTIGRCYLEQCPEKFNLNIIIAELNLPPIDFTMHNRFLIKNWINNERQRDFYRGETVTVNNWILSRTETNLCALMSLS